MFKRLIAFFGVFSIFMLFSTNALANDDIDFTLDYRSSLDYSDFYQDIITSEEWIETENRAIRGELLQLPKEMLLNMDTATLIDAVLNYPYFRDIYAFDDVQLGVDKLFRTFNGAVELLNRSNVGEILLDKYISMTVLSSNDAQTMDMVSVGDIVYELSNVEVLLAQDFVINSLSKSEIKVLSEAVSQKYTEKLSNNSYCGTVDSFYELFYANCDDVSIREQVSVLATYTYVSTPKGSKVLVVERGEELSADEIASNHKWVKDNYPSATRLGSSTTKYNCHSYAWYSQSTSNKYWMVSPLAYINDGSYLSAPSPVKNNRMIWFTNGEPTHSAIVQSVLSGPVNMNYGYTDLVIVNSKWGQLGLYRHNGMNSPYWDNNTYTAFYLPLYSSLTV